jgi:hypothetical protein
VGLGNLKGDKMDEEVKIGPYTQAITGAIIQFASAVSLAMNMRDRAVIEEMERVSADIFKQANEALNDAARNMQ